MRVYICRYTPYLYSLLGIMCGGTVVYSPLESIYPYFIERIICKINSPYKGVYSLFCLQLQHCSFFLNLLGPRLCRTQHHKWRHFLAKNATRKDVCSSCSELIQIWKKYEYKLIYYYPFNGLFVTRWWLWNHPCCAKYFANIDANIKNFLFVYIDANIANITEIHNLVRWGLMAILGSPPNHLWSEISIAVELLRKKNSRIKKKLVCLGSWNSNLLLYCRFAAYWKHDIDKQTLIDWPCKFYYYE